MKRHVIDWVKRRQEEIDATPPPNPNLYLFYGGPFSNWHPVKFLAPHPTIKAFAPIWFESSEHYYMWLKARHFGDQVSAAHIMRQGKYPAICKRLGKQVTGYDEAEWARVRYDYMMTALRLKFGPKNRFLVGMLLSTGTNVIAEASPTDKIWGIGLTENNPLAQDEKNWRGQNLLGRALMQLRDQLQPK